MISQIDIANLKQRGLTNQTLLSKVMTPEPIWITPSDTLAHVLYLLDHHNFSSIPVVDGWRLVGIITRSDIIRVEAAYLNGREDMLNSNIEGSRIIYQTRAPEIGQGRLLILIVNSKTAEAILKIAMAIAHERHYEIEVLHIVVVPRHRSLNEVSVNTALGQRLLRSAIGLGQIWKVPVHTQIRLAYDQSEVILEVIKTCHINLMLMDWKGNTKTLGRNFSRVMDKIIRHAECDVMLVKANRKPKFDRWLLPRGAKLNSESVMQLLPMLIKLSYKPVISLCQILDIDRIELNEITLNDLDNSTRILQDRLKIEVVVTPIYTSLNTNSIAKSILEYAEKVHSDIIVLEASREDILHGIYGSISATISSSSSQTVIVLSKS